MRLSFLADADLNQAIVAGVKRRVAEIDFQSATEAGLDGLSDQEVIRLAAEGGREPVSHDFRTMRYEFAEFVANSVSSGVILVSQNAGVGWAIDELIRIWALTEAGGWENRIAPLPYLPTER